MKNAILLLLCIVLLFATVSNLRSRENHVESSRKPIILTTRKTPERKKAEPDLRPAISQLKKKAATKGYSTAYAFLIDMSIPSGKNRFFVIDLKGDSVVSKGLVAHGSCNEWFSQTASYSNTPNTGCSSLGFYKIGYAYNGRFGKAYKLHGLDPSNSNAYRRYVVLHAYDCVPDTETYPEPLCNSLGCPMISYGFLRKISALIDNSEKPILLWITDPSVR